MVHMCCILPLLLLTKLVSGLEAEVLPIARRQQLIERSKAINPMGTYMEPRWSNRGATVLTPIQLNPGVYTGDRAFYWNNIDVSCRMTVVELPNNQLWVHSPVRLDGPTKEAIDKIGNVSFIVTPNYEHVSFAAEWALAFPKAQKVGCPGLTERKPEIPWSYEIPNGYRPIGWKRATVETPESNNIGWDTAILQPLHINIERNPFSGRPFFEEVIYYHAPTKTLIVTDFWWNYPQDVVPNSQFNRDDTWELAPRVDNIPWSSKLWKTGMDKVYKPFYNNFMVSDKDGYRDITHHILNVWDVETIIPAHGDIVRGKDVCRRILSAHLGA